MINALGLLEVDGMVAAIDAADAMLKAANVRLLSGAVNISTSGNDGRRSGCPLWLAAGKSQKCARTALFCRDVT